AMFLHIHGGGWVMGRPHINDEGNEHLARDHGLAVLSVDYRLAPEDPYPAGPDDCEAAAVWMLEHGPELWGTDKMFIGGESAGGHLAAVTLLRVRDRLGALDRVLGANLVFGVYDLRGTPSTFDNGGNTDFMNSSEIPILFESFTPGMSEAERRDPDVSPLFADLSGLPPCLVSVGTFDHLLDDSLFLATRLAAAESPVELAVYPDSPHGFMFMPSEMTKDFNQRLDAWITSLLP
ncbi:MAG: alpha/beta hydrolase, partial [bacterium]|nr:alpha/beta hydrolase [bacterium]